MPHSGPPMAAPAKTPRGANVATPGIEDGGGDEKPRGCLLMDFSKVRADIELPYICLRNILACVCMDAQNRFGDKTAFALARALENDTWLIGLNLSGNFINETGAQHLLRSLHDNSSLVELKLDGNPGITPVTLAVRIERFSSNLAARGVCYDSVCVSCAAQVLNAELRERFLPPAVTTGPLAAAIRLWQLNGEDLDFAASRSERARADDRSRCRVSLSSQLQCGGATV